jgi:hypothetical protein
VTVTVRHGMVRLARGGREGPNAARIDQRMSRHEHSTNDLRAAARPLRVMEGLI